MEEEKRPTGRSSSEQAKATIQNEATPVTHSNSEQQQETVSNISETENLNREGQPTPSNPSQSANAASGTGTNEAKTTQSTPPVVNPLDHHANERTFNSWQRTSAAYLVIGIALAKFFKGLTAIAGFIFFLIGCVIVVFAALRFESKRNHIDKFQYPAETIGPWIVTLCTVGVGVLSLAALWSGGKPAVIKNGRLFF